MCFFSSEGTVYLDKKKLSFYNSFQWQRCEIIMARIHAIEIFYASSNPSLGKILLKFSDGEGGILRKKCGGENFVGDLSNEY